MGNQPYWIDAHWVPYSVPLFSAALTQFHLVVYSKDKVLNTSLYAMENRPS